MHFWRCIDRYVDMGFLHVDIENHKDTKAKESGNFETPGQGAAAQVDVDMKDEEECKEP